MINNLYIIVTPKEKENIIKKIDVLKNNIFDETFNNNILFFMESYFETKLNINDTIIDDYICMWINKMDILKQYYMEENSINILTKILDTRITASKPQRVNTAVILIRFGDSYSFKNMTIDVLYALLKYINE